MSEAARLERPSPTPVSIVASVCCLIVVAVIVIGLNPVGYAGGRWDDGRYLEAARSWLANGPSLGRDHWALRWPVVLPTVVTIEIWGLARAPLMLVPLLTWVSTVSLLFAMVVRRWGLAAAFTSSFAFITVPAALVGATRISADSTELLFWTSSLWCFLSACEARDEVPRLRLIGAGALAALAFATRETAASLIVFYGIACACRVLPRKTMIWIAAGFVPLLLAEYAVWFAASGDWLWRFRVDMNHVNVPSTMMTGAVAHQSDPIGNVSIAEKWMYPGPIKLWWPINPFLNLFARIDYGFLFPVLGLLALLVARMRRAVFIERRWAGWIVMIAAGQIAFNVIILVTDPQPRMFLPAIYLACILLGLFVKALADDGRSSLVLPVFPILLAGSIGGIDEEYNFIGAEDAAAALIDRVREPVYVDPYSGSHLALIPMPQAGRVRRGRPRLDGLALTLQRPVWGDDPFNRNVGTLPAGQCWRFVDGAYSGRARALATLTALFGIGDREKLLPPFRIMLLRRTAC